MTDKPSQSERFMDVARELGCDEDEARWDQRLHGVATHKPQDQQVNEPAK